VPDRQNESHATAITANDAKRIQDLGATAERIATSLPMDTYHLQRRAETTAEEQATKRAKL